MIYIKEKVNNMKRFYTTGNVARYCEVNVDTVKRWIRQGILEAFPTPGGHFRITRSAFVEFIHQHGFPYEEDFFEGKASRNDILIIDDDKELLKLFSLMLEDLYSDLKIELSTDGFDGYEKLCLQRPRLLLLDLRLPGMTGMELLRVIRSRGVVKNTKIVIISGFLDDPTVSELKSWKVDWILSKPVRKDDLKEMCDQLLDKIVNEEI